MIARQPGYHWRLRAAAGLSFAVVLLIGTLGLGCQREPPTAATIPADLSTDDRIAGLFGPCVRDDYYDRDTSDLVDVLVQKLERGDRDVLSRAIEELGALGAQSIEPLRRAIETWANDRDRFGPLQSALAAAGLNPDPAARELLWIGLAHPFESVRGQAMRAFGSRPAHPADFERFEARLWLDPALRSAALAALAASDPERFADRALDWMEEQSAVAQDPALLRLFARHATDAHTERALRLATDAPDNVRAWLLAPAAALGDQSARDAFAAELAHPDMEVRGRALGAALEVNAWRLTLANLRSDPAEECRLLAAQLIAPFAGEERAARDGLAGALDDPSRTLADFALSALLAAGDPEAINRALVALDGPADVLGPLMLSLRGPMREHDGLAERVHGRLQERIEREKNLPLGQRAPALQALGHVPLAAVALLLIEVGAAAAPDARIDGLHPHRWMAIQAANSGPTGRAALAQRLADEEDPIRRLDLLWAIAAERDAVAKAELEARVEDDSADERERLFAAALLIRHGPSTEVAPRLKRVALRLQTEARRALQCLLWTWY